ncbi:uncharacterized protein LOC141908521 [Tubulanus polymorphus]|uniref:uncharacterized protein LOC141908521 n=1 Tax=Tubulanus polymorphus TaxID=672921 RepID=UPI003DA6B804
MWHFECENSGYVGNDCTLSKLVNDYKRPINFTCRDDGLLTGVWSIHDNGKEDRIWKFRCCNLITKEATKCSNTGYWNKYDGELDYVADPGIGIRGLESVFDDWKNDRMWSIHICRYAICIAKRMTILDEAHTQLSGMRVIGVSSSHNCRNGTNNRLTMSSTKDVKETLALTITRGSTFMFENKIEVKHTESMDLLFVGASISMGIGASFGKSKTTSVSTSNSKTVSSGTGQGQWTEYRGPGATLMFGTVSEYKLDKNEVRARLEIECTDGHKFEEEQLVPIKQTTFDAGSFTTLEGHFNPGMCSFQTDECLANIGGENIIEPQTIVNQFHNCFKGGIGQSAKR